MIQRASLYWHTLRYLRPAQIGGRVWTKLYRPSTEFRPAPAKRSLSGSWVVPARRVPSMLGEMTFRFLNETRRIDNSTCGVDAPAHLWHYNLHYFDDLNAFDAETRHRWHVEAIENWIRDHPPGMRDAWAPYPTSLRVVNWIKWALGGAVLEAPVADNLAMQVRVLTHRLEYHLLGNHLFANAKALVFAGLFFDGEEAVRWLGKGMAILAREMPEQILADGGQFERSPMYHALALEDVVDLINVTTVLSDGVPKKWQAFVGSWPALAQRMRAWLLAMCHPDGEIAFFNDAAIGIAPSPGELDRYANETVGALDTAVTRDNPLQVLHLADSGYVRADVPDAGLLIDVAPVGPDYLPGHAHADTLSFELSLFGQRVIVNGGTSRYGLGPERETERGTPAHSTVTVDGQNSSEVWAGFRVARRARPFDLAIRREGGRLEVSCAHDGYRRLAGRPVHRRTWLFQAGRLRVEDRVEGSFPYPLEGCRFKSAVARFHLHPAVSCTLDESGSSGRLRVPGGHAVHWSASGGSVRVERSFYSPEFGRRGPTQCLAVEFDGAATACMELTW